MNQAGTVARPMEGSGAESPMLAAGSGLLALLIMGWLIYVINGFRLPWSPIVVSDLDSGAALRQALFGAAGAVALGLLFVAGSLGPALVRRKSVVGLGLGMLATVVYSASPVLTVKRSIIFLCAVLALSAFIHRSHSPVRTMQRMLIGGTGIAAWLSIFGWLAFPVDAVSIAERPGLAGVSGHPNTLAPVMVIGFLVSLGVPDESRSLRLRVIQAGVLIALFLSNSITSIALLITSSLLFLCMTVTSYRRGVAQIALVVVTALVFFIGPQAVKHGLFETAGRDPSLSGRNELWKEVFLEGLETPVFGNGFGAFWYEGRGREIVGTWNPRQAHNAYVDVFVDLGVVGVAFVVLLFVGGTFSGWLRLANRDAPECRRAAASMVAVGLSLMGIYAFGESFFLKPDKFPMFCLLWFTLLLGNRGANGMELEFPETSPTASSLDPRGKEKTLP